MYHFACAAHTKSSSLSSQPGGSIQNLWQWLERTRRPVAIRRSIQIQASQEWTVGLGLRLRRNAWSRRSNAVVQLDVGVIRTAGSSAIKSASSSFQGKVAGRFCENLRAISRSSAVSAESSWMVGSKSCRRTGAGSQGSRSSGIVWMQRTPCTKASFVYENGP